MASVNSPGFHLPSDQLGFDISPLLGGILAGTFLACAVWGASSFQAFLYFMNCDKDPIYIKCLVGILWVLDTANQVLLASGNWRALVSQYGSPVILIEAKPEFLHHAWLASLVYCSVELYFIHRIYVFAKSSVFRPLNLTIVNVISTGLAILAVSPIISVAVYIAYGYGRPQDALITKLEIALHLSGRVAAVIVDVVVAAFMVFLLARQAPKFKRSRETVHRLLIITVGSGLLTAVLVTTVLILVVVYPRTWYWAIVDFPLCSVYLSTLLANLNTRDYIKGTYQVNTSPRFETNGTTVTPSNTTLVLGDLRGGDQTKELHPVNVPDRVCIHVQRHIEQDCIDTFTSAKAEA